MRGDDEQSGHLFSHLSPEQRVPVDHPLRAIPTMTAGVTLMAFAWAEEQNFRETALFAFAFGAGAVTAGLLFWRDPL